MTHPRTKVLAATIALIVILAFINAGLGIWAHEPLQVTR